MLELKEQDGGVVVPIHAQPRARKNGVVGLHAGRLKIAVTQPPEKGKANTALLKVLAKALGLKNSQLSLLSGETSQQKTVLVTGVSVGELQTRLQKLLRKNS